MNSITQTDTKTPAPRAEAGREPEALLPPVDVLEDAQGITLYADLPGVPKDKLQLRVEDDQLSIDAELVFMLPPQLQALHAEVRSSHYRRTFTLSKELDGDKIEAELSHGVLRVRIPKADHAQPRRIEVRSS